MNLQQQKLTYLANSQVFLKKAFTGQLRNGQNKIN